LVGEAAHGPPGLGVEPLAGAGEQPGGVEDPAVAVELVLVVGAVADADRAAVGVAGPAVQFPFRGWVAAMEGEQDGEAGPVQAAGVEQPAWKWRASSYLPTPRKAPMPMLASRGQA
jgi:hypothetical protein